MTRLCRDPGFARYWAGETISQFGDRVSELALPLIAVTLLTATPVQVSVLTALIWLPNLLACSSVRGWTNAPTSGDS